jgi:hypothetical protein
MMNEREGATRKKAAFAAPPKDTLIKRRTRKKG